MREDVRAAFGEQVVAVDGDSAAVRPRNLAEARRLVAWTHERSGKLVCTGGGTKRHWLDSPQGPTLYLDTRGLNRIVEHEPNDMTVTVECGLTLAALQATLAANGQRLTLDPPQAERATIGGILSTNDSGPMRLGNGTARDLVIGMSMIRPDGEVFKSGGRVVKNVAGYDLHKLYIGGFGTLGPIATATFRLRPLPEARGLVLLHPADADDAERMVAMLLAGETRPTMIDLLNARMAGALDQPTKLTLVVGFEENVDAVRWQTTWVARHMGGSALSESDSQALYERIREAPGAPIETAFKATMLSSQVAGFVARMDQHALRIVARAGSGIVHGFCEHPLEEHIWREMLDAAAASDGNIQVRGRLPGPFVNRFGRRRGDALLSDGIRRAFDPTGMFAPERLGPG